MFQRIFLTSLTVFLICLCIHIVVWRTRYPKNRPAALLLIFIVLPATAAAMLLALNYLYALTSFNGNRAVIPPVELAAACLLHFSLSAAYIMSYPAVEAVSPSLMITLMIGSSNGAGVTKEEIIASFDNKFLIEPRIKDLVDANMLTEVKGLLSLTSRGRRFVIPFIVLRRVLGLPVGGG